MQLTDVTVLDLTRLLPGPYATQLLSDLGATVIKVEQPGVGDYARAMASEGDVDVFSAVNRGKKSVTLNLKHDDARDAFIELATNADVVIESFRPGVVDRLGIGYDEIRAVNPDIVYCSLSGFGATGPHRDRAGHDLSYVSMAGVLDMTRAEKGGRPVIPGFPIADMAGGLFAAFAIVSALLNRELGTGDGEHIDVALTDVVTGLSHAVSPQVFAGETPAGRETTLTGAFPCYDVYETADGRYVTLAALEPEFWQRFCDAVDRPDLVSKQYAADPAEREAVREAIADVFLARTRDEWEKELGDTDAMVAPVYTIAETLDSEQARDRDLVWGEDNPRVGFPARTRHEIPRSEEWLPGLGEHTEDVLLACGFDESEIDALRSDGAI